MASSFGKRRRSRRSFGAFGGGRPSTLLGMEGPYMASGFGKRRSFGAFGGGRPSTLLGMEGPYMAM